MPEPSAPRRVWPAPDLTVWLAAIAFLEFLADTAVSKLDGLSEHQARLTPLRSSPLMSLLGLVKHLTAVQREHIQINIGGSVLPSLWRADDHDFEFRISAEETIASVVALFDAERRLTATTLAPLDQDSMVTAHGEPVRAGRLFIDVVQESARHVGHMDIIRELIDGTTGE